MIIPFVLNGAIHANRLARLSMHCSGSNEMSRRSSKARWNALFAIRTSIHERISPGPILTRWFSVISVMDRSLPNKPCKTCKNRFHASCLYKVRRLSWVPPWIFVKFTWTPLLVVQHLPQFILPSLSIQYHVKPAK